MIDVIFLLLLFFVMVTSFEASAKVRVDIPHPEKSKARRAESANQLVINCEYSAAGVAGGEEVAYRLGGDQPEPLSVISTRLAAARLANPKSIVLIRADRRLPNVRVRDVIRVVAANGFETVNVSARQELEP